MLFLDLVDFILLWKISHNAIKYLIHAHDLILLDSSYNDHLQDLSYEFIQIEKFDSAIKVLKQILSFKPR